MLRSECCGAIVYDYYDLCSECIEHCDVWDDDEDEDDEDPSYLDSLLTDGFN